MKKMALALAISVVGMTQEALCETLTIAGRDSSYGEALQYVADKWQEAHPDDDVTVVKSPGKGLYEKLVVSLREQTGQFDVAFIDDTWATEFMSNGWLADLPASFNDDGFIPAALAISKYPVNDGQLYSIPMVGNVEMFAWNKAMFDQAGLERPKNWPDVLRAAEKLNKDDVSGVVFRGTRGNPIVTGFLPILWAYGGEVVTTDGHSGLNSKAAKQAVDMFVRLKGYAPKGVDVYNADEVRQALQTGKAAMALEIWPAWIPDLDNAEKSSVVDQVEVMPEPSQDDRATAMLGIWQLAVPADSSKKALATQFVEFATSPEMQKMLALKIGIPPTRSELYQDQELIEKYRWYPQQLDALEAGRARPRIKQWGEVESVLGDFLQLALSGQMPPEQALQMADQRINQVLKK